MTSDFDYVQPPQDNNPQRRATDKILPKADLSDPSLHTAKELRKILRIQTWCIVILSIVLLAVAGYAYNQGRKNTRALCAIRANAENRLEQTQQFLRDHPNGIAGISVADLQRSLNAYTATIRSLDDVDCPPKPS